MSTPTSPLFRPARVGAWELPNRVVMAPMTRSRADDARVPPDLAARYYAQRAGAGLIVSEAAHAHPRGYGYPNTPGLETEAQRGAWRRVTDAVHARGGRIVAQLLHTGRVGHPSLFPDAARPVAPSAIAPEGLVRARDGMQPYVTPRALDIDELPGIAASYGDGARWALEAGFDGVELHGAFGYLLDQFLRDGSNRRTDAYGGPVERRARLLLESVDAAASAIGADRVGVRLSPGAEVNSMHDSDPATTFPAVARLLAPLGLAYLHLVDPAPAGAPFTDAMRAAFGGTLIVNGGYDRASADAVLGAGRADLVSFGAPFVANPDLVDRLRDGAPLAAPDPSTFYGGDARGYVDYPQHDGTVWADDEALLPARAA
ncbi:alkene reductase [Roseisolibacter sp. H3M3-2]|uniref:alkene reductase n=1 Tax=Roseisolibacter sp. H3M3-2 TaxID=3031323 RepID=UPI0023D9BF7A|nr:alkene reductase [Roseisolibacter sp. H3M3-2]MDF1502692.1 alkene reductase [Roseisolibacter sp. H3M3-2]